MTRYLIAFAFNNLKQSWKSRGNGIIPKLLVFALACLPFVLANAQTNPATPGMFTADTDIGTPHHAGSAKYDAAQRTYTVGGGGVNM
jgi:hypothetical protein